MQGLAQLDKVPLNHPDDLMMEKLDSERYAVIH